MFSFLKRSPEKKLEAELQKLLQESRDLQRKGDIQGCSEVTARAEEVGKQLDALRAERG